MPLPSNELPPLIPQRFLLRGLCTAVIVAVYYSLEWMALGHLTRSLVQWSLTILGYSPQPFEADGAAMIALNGQAFAFVSHCTYVDLFLVLSVFIWRPEWNATRTLFVLANLACLIVVGNVLRITLTLHLHQIEAASWDVLHHYPDLALHIVLITIAVIAAFKADFEAWTAESKNAVESELQLSS